MDYYTMRLQVQQEISTTGDDTGIYLDKLNR